MNAPFDGIAPKPDAVPLENERLSRRLIAETSNDTIWITLRGEAAQERTGESELGALYAAILEARNFEEALVSRLAARLGHPSLPAKKLKSVLLAATLSDASIGQAARADISAVIERDPAAARVLEPFLFFKGYAAIQAHRLAHWLWNTGRRDLALYLQSRSSEVFQSDIHPAAQFGRGILLDHATGFVAGETVVIEDNVSILHGVTLGGTGTEKAGRHPKIRTGVLIGAGAQIIGDIEIGAYSRIAAGSLVTQHVPARCTAVGVPARIIDGAGSNNPAENMDQGLAQASYDSFTYVI